MADRGFMVDEKGELVLRNGTIAVGDTLTQDVALLMLTNKGEVRHDMFAGCDLLRRMNSRMSRSEFERIVRIQLERDGKQWPVVKDGIRIRSNE
ncbi:MAG: hypothetical protein KIT10_14615 [Flavobacteriales bacterium]|nr:hypothetical protein [Flavobacteriales bacterium]